MTVRRVIAAAIVAGTLTVTAAPAFGAEQHPPKFGVHETQCTGGSNQPNCPGSH